ncbi:hypothetical protein HED64_03270 [Paeniglutamicibacter sp. ANT13_2]|uniref:Uncharacterized protein n=1 Tax=Paeniglutamicibacter terrestris TaxID=2723403 RepID=A0ABX1G2C0_9MICC|nr:hypothetical protein [Paeniglutamicibacter terrestris]
MLKALQQTFVTAFSTTCTMGSMATFVVTVSDMNLLNIHAAWGGLIGYIVSRLLERGNYATTA